MQGHIFGDLGNFKEAAEAFKKAVEMQPNNSDFRADYAHSLFLSGQKALALRVVMRLKKIDNEEADLIYSMIKGRAISEFRVH